MADYTIELRRYIDSFSYGSSLPRKEILDKGRRQLFDFDYPFFDEDYRETFETHFVTHFYMREIGFETIGLFKMRLEDWLNLNMPYYNQLFLSEKITFDPLTNTRTILSATTDKDRAQTTNMTGNTEVTDQSQATGTKNTDETLTEKNFNRELTSSMPEDRLQLVTDPGENVLEYADQITENHEDNLNNRDQTVTNTTNQNSTSGTDTNMTGGLNQSDTETFHQVREGKVGSQSFAQLLLEYRRSLLRVEKQVFDEMNELFMLVY